MVGSSDATRPHSWRPGTSPTLLALHGTGGDERSLLPLAERIAPDAAVLAPRGTVREGDLNRHFRRHAEGVLDAENLYAQTDALADFLRSFGADHGVVPGEVIAVGFSNGANIATSLLARHRDLIRAAILIGAMPIPLEVPLAAEALAGLPVAIVNGDVDELVSPADTAALHSLLADAGATVTVLDHRGGHEIPETRLDDLAAFITTSKEPLR
ncbi:alpha/beta hydrolase [Gordonia phthalatica]|uniref:Serine hydrolase domain-containing protein n=1 Tax=Gordonia phthalatica TaxID=1136941 RepID=A0A0N9N2M0_9ACTN|nr:alpha/beta hydrolase [Gordonia phthalatica]ALG84892.1 hypothetical protein ACH46_10770 [Gordonia phthalatica]